MLSNLQHRIVDRDMTMRYHWGLAVGHLYTHVLSRRNVAPISTSPELERLRHGLDTVEQGPDIDGGSEPPEKEAGPDADNVSPDSDEGEIPDSASDVYDRDHWDHEGGNDLDYEDRDQWDDEGSDTDSEHDFHSDSQHDSETDSVLLEMDAMYGDTVDVEWTSFD
jgi:hypothetical protein